MPPDPKRAEYLMLQCHIFHRIHGVHGSSQALLYAFFRLRVVGIARASSLVHRPSKPAEHNRPVGEDNSMPVGEVEHVSLSLEYRNLQRRAEMVDIEKASHLHPPVAQVLRDPVCEHRSTTCRYGFDRVEIAHYFAQYASKSWCLVSTAHRPGHARSGFQLT